MHANPDSALSVRQALWQALLHRRAPLWLLMALPCLALLPDWPNMLAGLALWLIFLARDLYTLRKRLHRDWCRWLDAAVPALEDSSALLAAADPATLSAVARLQQARLWNRLATVLLPQDYRDIARRVLPFAWPWVALSVLAAGALWWTAHHGGLKAVAPQFSTAVAAKPGELILHIEPPTYTGLAAYDSAARDLQVPEYSEIQWCAKASSSAPMQVELSDGQILQVGEQCAGWTARESVFWRGRAAAGQSGSQPNSQLGARYTLRVQPDQASQITIKTPTELITVLDRAAKFADMAITVRDDYAIVRASLHLTLARGSGENIRFQDKEMPLPQATDVHVRDWQKRWSLAELGMEPGDDLYFFVRATDNAPDHPHTSQSPTYTLRLPGNVEEDIEASALPSLVKPESLRSQRQIIIDTEQLLADMKANPKLDARLIRDRSETIAGEQGKLRRRYGQFMGEESSLFDDGKADDHEGEHGNEGGKNDGKGGDIIAQYGHAHDQAENATLFDEATKAILRRVLLAMWEAEKALRAITPAPALPFEYKALDAIKQLQQADRIYLHRTAFVPPAMKEEKRMTGDLVGALSFKREQGEPPEAVPAEMRALVAALGTDAPLPAMWTAQARDWIRSRIKNEEQSLAAQRSLQDVADGCSKCRLVLAAWLRGAITDAPVVLQARGAVDTKLTQAWRSNDKPRDKP